MSRAHLSAAGTRRTTTRQQAVNQIGRDLLASTYGQRKEPRERVAVPFSTGPNSFVLLIENDAMGEAYRVGGYVIVDPDQAVEPGDVVVAVAEGAMVAILRELVIEGSERKLVARNDSYQPMRAGKVIGPVVGYWFITGAADRSAAAA